MSLLLLHCMAMGRLTFRVLCFLEQTNKRTKNQDVFGLHWFHALSELCARLTAVEPEEMTICYELIKFYAVSCFSVLSFLTWNSAKGTYWEWFDLGQLAVGSTAWAGGWTWWDPELLSSLKLSAILWFFPAVFNSAHSLLGEKCILTYARMKTMVYATVLCAQSWKRENLLILQIIV